MCPSPEHIDPLQLFGIESPIGDCVAENVRSFCALVDIDTDTVHARPMPANIVEVGTWL